MTAWPLSDFPISAAACAPGNDDGGTVTLGAALALVPPGNGPLGGFLAGPRKILRRVRASSSVMPCRSHRFRGAKSFGGLQGSTKTGNTKFGLPVTESHCAAPRSQLEY